jgi:hypothetical protein
MSLISEKYGAPALAVAPTDASPLHSTTVQGPSPVGPLSPDNPMLWLVGIAAAAIGLVSFSVSGKAGPLKASASV